MGLKHKQESSEINFISSGLSLVRYNVPFLGIWHFRGEIRHTGSKCTTDWYKNLDEQTKTNLKLALISDMNSDASESKKKLTKIKNGEVIGENFVDIES